MRIFTLTIAMALVTSWVTAQEYTFKVLLNKGENTLNTTNGQAVTVKSELEISGEGEIVMKNESFLGLLHKSGKILQLRGEGTYTIEQLEQQVMEAKRNSRFNQYIPARMSDNERNRMNKGTRAVDKTTSLAVMLPEMADLYGDVVYLKWQDESAEGDPNYEVQVLNIFGEPIFTDQTTENSYKLDFSELESDVALYSIVVKNLNTGAESMEYKVKKVAADEVPEVTEDLEVISQEINTNSPLELLILTTVYQKNDLPLDAMNQYEEVLERYPDYDEIREYYNDFLASYGLIKK